MQLTDASELMLADEKVYGHIYEGQKFDCGSRNGYVQAIAHLATGVLGE